MPTDYLPLTDSPNKAPEEKTPISQAIQTRETSALNTLLKNQTRYIDLNTLTVGDLIQALKFIESERKIAAPELSSHEKGFIATLNLLNIIGLFLTTATYAWTSGTTLSENLGGKDRLSKQISGSIFAVTYYFVNVFVQHASNELFVRFAAGINNKRKQNGYAKNINLFVLLISAVALTICATIAVLQQNLDADFNMQNQFLNDFMIWNTTGLKAIQLFRGVVYLLTTIVPYFRKKSFSRDTDKLTYKAMILHMGEWPIPTNEAYSQDSIEILAYKRNSNATLTPLRIGGLWITAIAMCLTYSYLGYAKAMDNSNFSSLSWVTFGVMLCLFANANFSVMTQLIDSRYAQVHCSTERKAKKTPARFYLDREPSKAMQHTSAAVFILGALSLGGAAGVASTEAGISMETLGGWLAVFGIAFACAIMLNCGDSHKTLLFLRDIWITEINPRLSKPESLPWINRQGQLEWISQPFGTLEDAQYRAKQTQHGSNAKAAIRKAISDIAHNNAEQYITRPNNTEETLHSRMIDDNSTELLAVKRLTPQTAISQCWASDVKPGEVAHLELTHEGKKLADAICTLGLVSNHAMNGAEESVLDNLHKRLLRGEEIDHSERVIGISSLAYCNL